MASDIKTTSEDADMAECDGEKVVTMMDVLQEQEDFEEDANAVLGASDDKECTYSKGYIKRQAIYACMTCCPEAKSDSSKRAGVCLACSLMCHENHELVELYTKRNFRCDCGNSKFNSHPCTFTPDKTDLNEDNYYNQNFSGLYCTCQRPYPDPESTVEDEMIQCIICEDWLHASHLESTVPANEQYSEMICKLCMEKNEFLHDYSELAVNIESVDVDVVQINGSDAHNPKLCNGDSKMKAISSTLSDNITKSGTEITEEKPEENVNATETTLKSKEGSEESASKDESHIIDKKEDESMETNQTEQGQLSDATLEEATAPVIEEPSNNKTVQDEITESESKDDTIPKTDEISKQISAESTTDTIENSSDTTPVLDQSENNDEPREKNSEDTTKPNEPNPTNEAEQSEIKTEEKVKASEQNAEKMEEDKLLAEPEGSTEKTEPIKDNNTNTDSDITNNDTVTNANEEPKSEIEPNSESNEKSNTCNEKPDSEVSENTVENDNVSHIDNISETNPSTSNDSSSENKISSESVIEEDKNTEQSKVQNESTTDESSSSEKISEKRKLLEETSEIKEAKKQKLDDSTCVRPKGIKKMYKGATFWPSNFRQKLCTCQECISMYNDLSVLFLTDPEDTVTAYENLGKQKINGKPTTQYERGLQALSSLDRIQQINALTEYNKMRDRLLDFLKSFKDKKEIVKEEDIKAFFAGMRPKREPDGVYFCR